MKQLRRRGNRRGLDKVGRGNAEKRRFASRTLFAEQLEDRRLLTTVGGGDDYPFHNKAIAHDVSGDWVVSPRDALMVINELNSGGARSS
jgi:hypothetical protein